uniref:Transposase Tc1-like domain-containing protein n=1 Tax=Pundamilia nyererei TaxID=303518 RepID=A0A3B4GP91_9CICH
MLEGNGFSFTIKRHSGTGANSGRKRSGRPKDTTESEAKFLRVNSLRDRWLTGQQLQACRSTQVLPSLRRQNKTERLAWAMKHHHWTTEDWKKVLWTDEKNENYGTRLHNFQ